jgi:hypothetical protein
MFQVTDTIELTLEGHHQLKTKSNKSNVFKQKVLILSLLNIDLNQDTINSDSFFRVQQLHYWSSKNIGVLFSR